MEQNKEQVEEDILQNTETVDEDTAQTSEPGETDETGNAETEDVNTSDADTQETPGQRRNQWNSRCRIRSAARKRFFKKIEKDKR